jgi:uncharacterized protein YndB with AHSA1/START domain
MENSNPVVVEETYNATVEKVWNAITSYGEMKQWYFEEIESFKPEVGFNTQFSVQANGNDYLHIWKVTEVIPMNKIVYNWTYRDYEGDSYVTWELSSESDKTKLKLSHFGIESFPQDNPDFTRESCTGGWTYFLCHRLKDYLDKD